MATENFYGPLDGTVVAHVQNLSDTNDFDVTPSDYNEGVIAMHTYVVGGACDVKMLVDSGGDFASPETTITLDSFSGSGISEGNATPLHRNRVGLRVTNTSGGSADFTLIGRRVKDGDV